MPARAILGLALFAVTLDAAVEFNRDVRPILADKCFTCHGPDAAAKNVPFRLDRESSAKAALSGGRRAIVEGKPEESELIRRVTTAPKALRMPPLHSGVQLTDREVSTLRDWIAEGAKWEQHWAFIPPKRVPLPAVKAASWPRNAIDRFILDRLEREGLSPSAPAPLEIQLRRVTLALTGLPPTLAELDAFLADRSSSAYEKAVERLLASPHFGERMAARWLDAARYADTNGYQFDGPRDMWRWRDWVIDAFNANKRFDQFAIEQLAGDLLPSATREQRIATGFNRNHRINTEDGIVPEEYFVEQVVDRVETTSTVFLGLTLGCARCHNHKYDPFTQKEFYQLYAYFNNLPELGRGMKYGNTPPLVSAPTPDQQKQLDALDRKLEEARGVLARNTREVERAQRAWEPSAPAEHWAPASGLSYSLPRTEFDGVKVITEAGAAAFDIEDPWTIAAWVEPATGDGSIASRMSDRFKGKGFGVHLNHGRVYVNITSNWDDDAIRVETERTIAANERHHVAVSYDGSRLVDGLRIFIDGAPAAYKIETATLYRPFRNAGARFNEPFRAGGGWGRERRFRGVIDGLRVYARELDPREIGALAVSRTMREIASLAAAQRTASESFALRQYFLANAAPDAIRGASSQIAALSLERDRAVRQMPTVMVMEERPTPRETFLLLRGAYDKPGEKVARSVPAALAPLPNGAPANRLGLAQWLTSPEHPLTARVAVNRLWQMLFGTGLVKTTEDFGLQGEWPSHPELLDFLATEFVRSGWDVKALMRLMVTSETFRQSSAVTPALLQRDPENRLLARGPRFRLPAEMIRDQALFAAGLLNTRIGGPSVMPYQPAGLWKETAMQDMDYVQSHGPDLYRRSLYTFWKRTIAPPMMINFDAAGRETCVVRDNRTNTPLQALDLMNDVTFVEAARFVGQRMLKEGGADAASRLRRGFRLVTSREPSAAELKVLGENLSYHLDYFASHADAAAQFVAQGEAPADAAIPAQQLAAYAAVASLLLNLDEVVTLQ
jgi:hypothetical protein